MESFTPWSALGGGALIGLSASLLLAANGRIAGISGIVGELLTPRAGEVGWRVAFLAGLVVGGLGLAAFAPATLGASPASSGGVLAAGLLVGFGTRMANGCTSGHGVCGIPRGSVRSLTATAAFMAAAMLTVLLVGGA